MDIVAESSRNSDCAQLDACFLSAAISVSPPLSGVSSHFLYPYQQLVFFLPIRVFQFPVLWDCIFLREVPDDLCTQAGHEGENFLPPPSLIRRFRIPKIFLPYLFVFGHRNVSSLSA